MISTGITPLNGLISHSRLMAHRDFTVTNISFTSSGSTVTPTLVRFGIYTRSGTTFTLVARTASDTSIFAAANTKYTRALDTTGGYPATYSMTAGSEYWVSVIQVAATMAGILQATGRTSTGPNVATGGMYYSQSSQSDLVTSSTGTLSAVAGPVYAEVS
jgi:hypothetical protein